MQPRSAACSEAHTTQQVLKKGQSGDAPTMSVRPTDSIRAEEAGTWTAQTLPALLTVKRECETHSVGNDLDPGLKGGPCTAQIGTSRLHLYDSARSVCEPQNAAAVPLVKDGTAAVQRRLVPRVQVVVWQIWPATYADGEKSVPPNCVPRNVTDDDLEIWILRGMKLDIVGRGFALPNRELKMTTASSPFKHAEPFDAARQSRADRTRDAGGAQGCKRHDSDLR